MRKKPLCSPVLLSVILRRLWSRVTLLFLLGSHNENLHLILVLSTLLPNFQEGQIQKGANYSSLSCPFSWIFILDFILLIHYSLCDNSPQPLKKKVGGEEKQFERGCLSLLTHIYFSELRAHPKCLDFRIACMFPS